MRLARLIAIAIAVASCAQSSGPLEVSPGVYTISVHAAPVRGGEPGARALAVAEATSVCSRQDRTLVTSNLRSFPSTHFPGGTAEIWFSCGAGGAGALPDASAERRLDGTATGFVVSADSDLVTNHHVVAACANVRVRPPGKEAAAAVVVASDTENDLALLKAPVHLPQPVSLDDAGIRAGDSVVAVGFPLRGLLASEPMSPPGP